MALYEHVFLTRQDASNAQVDALTDQFKGLIASGGGKVTKTEYWGVKSLSFRIKKNRKAHYTLMNIDAPSAAVAEMERQMSISEDVIRHMTVKVEALEDGPSAQMRRRDDREERGERDVLLPLVRGYTNREKAEQLEISVKTIDLYRSRVMKRMQAETLAELVGMAIAVGLVDALDLRAAQAV